MKKEYKRKNIDSQNNIVISSLKIDNNLFKKISDLALQNERTIAGQMRYMIKQYLKEVKKCQ